MKNKKEGNIDNNKKMKNKEKRIVEKRDKINVRINVHEKGIYFHSFDAGELNNFNEDAGKEFRK